MKKPSQWIAAIARGHNAGVCLLKDGKVVDVKGAKTGKTPIISERPVLKKDKSPLKP